jgi:hypothetical protein
MHTAYCAAHAAANTISWAEFSTHFRNYHIPAGLMKIQKEFLSHKQGGMTVSEYRVKFIQLSRYAPREVDDDEKNRSYFCRVGLIRPLQCQLILHTFLSFQRLLDKAIALEQKRLELGEKRKATNQGQAGSSSRPHYTTPQSTPVCGSSGQQTQQTQATPQANTPAGPIAPNASTNRSCFKCGQAGHYVNYYPNWATYTTTAPMKQGQAIGGKS